MLYSPASVPLSSNGSSETPSAHLAELVYSNDIAFLMEAHDALSASIVAEDGQDRKIRTTAPRKIIHIDMDEAP